MLAHFTPWLMQMDSKEFETRNLVCFMLYLTMKTIELFEGLATPSRTYILQNFKHFSSWIYPVKMIS